MVNNHSFLIYVYKYLKTLSTCSVKCTMCLSSIRPYLMSIYFGMGYDIFRSVRVKSSLSYRFVP